MSDVKIEPGQVWRYRDEREDRNVVVDTVDRLLAAIDEREQRYAERARDWRKGMSEDELHQHRSHPAYLYSMTEGQRKAWDDADTPPDGDGWELNITSTDPDAFTRFDYHEERYWRRLNPDGPRVWEPSDEVAESLRLCQSHRDIVAMFPVSAPHVDTHGSFYGFQSRDCGEHRTVGPHRAWCFDCSEWCYPNAPCRRCHGVSEVISALARGYGIEEETTDDE